MIRDVSKVFTPRSSKVTAMYLQREDLEKDLLRKIRGSMHVFLHGESGNGKTWLFKKVLENAKLKHISINCASLSHNIKIEDVIYNTVFDSGEFSQYEQEDELSGGVSVGIANSKGNVKKKYKIAPGDGLKKAYAKLNNDNTRVIVFDNFESVYSDAKHMKDVAKLIMLLDDSKYQEYSIKFLFVGVPGDIIQFYRGLNGFKTVANRIEETKKIAGFSKTETSQLAANGFAKLQIKIPDSGNLYDHIYNCTMGIAQRIHEYCEKLAYIIEDNGWTYSKSLIALADQEYMLSSLREQYTLITAHLNGRETKTPRREQVLYAIGKNNTSVFDAKKIEEIIRKEFPKSIPTSNRVALGQIFKSLSAGDNAILRKKRETTMLELIDPRTIMALRLIVDKGDDGIKIKKRHFQIN